MCPISLHSIRSILGIPDQNIMGQIDRERLGLKRRGISPSSFYSFFIHDKD
nr:MAG TPA: hypothetical protein [Caudoviricetes sp.]